MNIATILSTFTPGEAERITNVSTAQQRDWRRRAILPSNEGHARFDAFAVAEMWTLKLLSDRGIGPQQAKEVASWCAIGIVWHALQWQEAYEGDHLRAYEWAPQLYEKIVTQRQEIEELIKEREVKGELDPAEFLAKMRELDTGHGWGFQAGYLQRQTITQAGKGRVIPTRFFIWWADGSHIWHSSVDAACNDGVSNDARFSGPIIVLDLNALGSTLIERAERPLVHVELIKGAADKGAP
ncbi:MerR family transcriptional regulator [Azospirillum doebereinerae]|uniref:HTH merR-type domain-containing protein n=1 Tax=Azospirillum doebereinerae TaxID=92933 RepID=A0A3S0XQC9_9PROT|nr:MerR family transcriptional regulator [Azospirillum doebereinerae]RUQ75067.1 hypothetical protein EJ913_04200 [Azospirillum doebereinerae]